MSSAEEAFPGEEENVINNRTEDAVVITTNLLNNLTVKSKKLTERKTLALNAIIDANYNYDEAFSSDLCSTDSTNNEVRIDEQKLGALILSFESKEREINFHRQTALKEIIVLMLAYPDTNLVEGRLCTYFNNIVFTVAMIIVESHSNDIIYQTFYRKLMAALTDACLVPLAHYFKDDEIIEKNSNYTLTKLDERLIDVLTNLDVESDMKINFYNQFKYRSEKRTYLNDSEEDKHVNAKKNRGTLLVPPLDVGSSSNNSSGNNVTYKLRTKPVAHNFANVIPFSESASMYKPSSSTSTGRVSKKRKISHKTTNINNDTANNTASSNSNNNNNNSNSSSNNNNSDNLLNDNDNNPNNNGDNVVNDTSPSLTTDNNNNNNNNNSLSNDSNHNVNKNNDEFQTPFNLNILDDDSSVEEYSDYSIDNVLTGACALIGDYDIDVLKPFSSVLNYIISNGQSNFMQHARYAFHGAMPDNIPELIDEIKSCISGTIESINSNIAKANHLVLISFDKSTQDKEELYSYPTLEFSDFKAFIDDDSSKSYSDIFELFFMLMNFDLQKNYDSKIEILPILLVKRILDGDTKDFLSNSSNFSRSLIIKLNFSSSIWFPIFEIDEDFNIICGIVIVHMASPTNKIFFYYDLMKCESEKNKSVDYFKKLITDSIKPFILAVLDKNKSKCQHSKINNYSVISEIKCDKKFCLSQIFESDSSKSKYSILCLCVHLIVFLDYESKFSSNSILFPVDKDKIKMFLEDFKYIVLFIVLNRQLSEDRTILNIEDIIKNYC